MQQDVDSASQLSDSVTKQMIFEKVRQRMETLENKRSEDSCSELNADVIVISDDTSLLFEPQNLQVTKWLRHRFKLSADNLKIRERIRVHPCQRRRIIAELKAAGFKVV
jgi:hypothetical protein